jgi:hypothetical protein
MQAEGKEETLPEESCCNLQGGKKAQKQRKSLFSMILVSPFAVFMIGIVQHLAVTC